MAFPLAESVQPLPEVASLVSGLVRSFVTTLIAELLVEKIERAREILRSKIDPNNTQPQAELSDEMEFMARKAQSK